MKLRGRKEERGKEEKLEQAARRRNKGKPWTEGKEKAWRRRRRRRRENK